MSGNYYTTKELMITEAANHIKNGEVCFIGTGLPMLAAYLAKMTHAPDIVLIFESGIIGSNPTNDLATSVADLRLLCRCSQSNDLFYALSLLQRGFIDLGFLGAAEIDQFGNINSTVIGNYYNPKVRLPGSGGANDIGSLAKRTLIIMLHQKRKFTSKLSYLTTPGFLDGHESREEAGLTGGGPDRVITDLCVLGFDKESKKMILNSIHPGVDIEQLKVNTQFEIIIPDKIKITEIPSNKKIRLIRELDSKKVYLK